jgi:hypothetical protein
MACPVHSLTTIACATGVKALVLQQFLDQLIIKALVLSGGSTPLLQQGQAEEVCQRSSTMRLHDPCTSLSAEVSQSLLGALKLLPWSHLLQ